MELMQQYGHRASEHAARHVSELSIKGDAAGAARWGDILAAIDAIRSRNEPLGPPTRRCTKAAEK
jgi:hypothetical protein